MQIVTVINLMLSHNYIDLFFHNLIIIIARPAKLLVGMMQVHNVVVQSNECKQERQLK